MNTPYTSIDTPDELISICSSSAEGTSTVENSENLPVFKTWSPLTPWAHEFPEYYYGSTTNTKRRSISALEVTQFEKKLHSIINGNKNSGNLCGSCPYCWRSFHGNACKKMLSYNTAIELSIPIMRDGPVRSQTFTRWFPSTVPRFGTVAEGWLQLNRSAAPRCQQHSFINLISRWNYLTS